MPAVFKPGAVSGSVVRAVPLGESLGVLGGGFGRGHSVRAALRMGDSQAARQFQTSSPRDLDELDIPAFPSHHYYRYAPTYSGTKSMYYRSPLPARNMLHRSQLVHSKSSRAGGVGASAPVGVGVGTGVAGAVAAATSLATVQSLLLRPQHAATVNQNIHNAQRELAYGGHGNGVIPGPTGSSAPDRRDSLYARRGPLSSEDSA